MKPEFQVAVIAMEFLAIRRLRPMYIDAFESSTLHYSAGLRNVMEMLAKKVPAKEEQDHYASFLKMVLADDKRNMKERFEEIVGIGPSTYLLLNFDADGNWISTQPGEYGFDDLLTHGLHVMKMNDGRWLPHCAGGQPIFPGSKLQAIFCQPSFATIYDVLLFFDVPEQVANTMLTVLTDEVTDVRLELHRDFVMAIIDQTQRADNIKKESTSTFVSPNPTGRLN